MDGHGTVGPFGDIEIRAAFRKGGADALETLLEEPLTAKQLASISSDRWLSCLTKCVFQAGFNWQIIDRKWPRFEEVFERFDVARWSMMSDADIDRLCATDGIVANGAKIASVGANANFLQGIENEYGTIGACFSSWTVDDYMSRLWDMQKAASRAGGRTGQIFLRRMGIDTVVFSPDVVTALTRAGVVTAMPKSKRDFGRVQSVISKWHAESGRCLTQISQILAYSVE